MHIIPFIIHPESHYTALMMDTLSSARVATSPTYDLRSSCYKNYLQQNQTTAKIAVQVIHIWADPNAVHPVAESC